jgi:hypothetical protein
MAVVTVRVLDHEATPTWGEEVASGVRNKIQELLGDFELVPTIDVIGFDATGASTRGYQPIRSVAVTVDPHEISGPEAVGIQIELTTAEMTTACANMDWAAPDGITRNVFGWIMGWLVQALSAAPHLTNFKFNLTLVQVS